MQPDFSERVFLNFIDHRVVFQKNRLFLYLLILTPLVHYTDCEDKDESLGWCVAHDSFYQDIKVCPTVHKLQPLYKTDWFRSQPDRSIRVQDGEFFLSGDSLYYNGSRKLETTTTLAITVVKKEQNEEPVIVSCFWLRLHANDKNCSFARNYTTVISILACLCLVLAAAFSISLIVIHRRTPLSCNLRRKKSTEEDNYCNTQPEAPFQPPNGIIVPRKSSLKVSRLEVTPVKDDPLKTGNGKSASLSEAENGEKKSFENEGYQESESSRRNSVANDDGHLSPDGPYPNQGRRKSTVTFSDKTEIIRIMKCT